ncbi:putative Coiled-coil domain containing protein 94 [Monocercomonoides exilis]|uniref:putative Coiled-coil domain containing protein 94 n=1 Tax=Monocercomonoides exilis TaxID=2049356 RepID=UPI00355A79CE|nr:putative Coiled-coil domain containing protein 94 [Monocercomonoides exilis]|eukprot:MONOS_1204.1-p1 / transcript=MONOS_1204.1 / gene=MONOS_1204 / organism=Monocercomonoides_exilis_PA203 / gene_product=Coiled-coil domain containing protein 94, putative / transcript_product=Coiled-coil domain containing protein 94, putative / location=Mono_scaffold00020:167506-168792(+) / protein_length=408 / sequence_SO=supercontig / SO=protein_coding / is_pseudo=false
MAERKVLNKYIPADFDPDVIPKSKMPKNMQFAIRMMLPMSIRCKTCGEFMPAGLKINSKQEIVKGDTWMGLRHYRFYMRCPRCAAEFTIKTNMEKDNYVCELNCVPHYTPHWQYQAEEEQKAKQERTLQDEDAIKALENRAKDNALEMEMDDVLRETMELNAHRSKMKIDDVLSYLKKLDEERTKKEEEEERKEIDRLIQGAKKIHNVGEVKEEESDLPEQDKLNEPSKKEPIVKEKEKKRLLIQEAHVIDDDSDESDEENVDISDARDRIKEEEEFKQREPLFEEDEKKIVLNENNEPNKISKQSDADVATLSLFSIKPTKARSSGEHQIGGTDRPSPSTSDEHDKKSSPKQGFLPSSSSSLEQQSKTQKHKTKELPSSTFRLSFSSSSKPSQTSISSLFKKKKNGK